MRLCIRVRSVCALTANVHFTTTHAVKGATELHTSIAGRICTSHCWSGRWNRGPHSNHRTLMEYPVRGRYSPLQNIRFLSFDHHHRSDSHALIGQIAFPPPSLPPGKTVPGAVGRDRYGNPVSPTYRRGSPSILHLLAGGWQGRPPVEPPWAGALGIGMRYGEVRPLRRSSVMIFSIRSAYSRTFSRSYIRAQHFVYFVISALCMRVLLCSP